MIQHAHHGGGREARRNRLNGQAEAHHAFFVISAAQQHLVIRNLTAIDLARVAEEPEVSHPVLAAGIGTTADFDRKAAHTRVVIPPQRLAQRGSQVHRLSKRQVAGVSAGASDDIIYMPRTGSCEADCGQRPMHLRQPRQRNERQQHVLIDGYAQRSVARGSRDACQFPQLSAEKIALLHAHRHRGVAGLLLLGNVGCQPRVILAVARLVTLDQRQQRSLPKRLRPRLVAAEALRYHLRPSDPAVSQDELVFLFHLFAQPLDAALAQHEFQPRLVLVGAIAVTVEDTDHRFAPVQQALLGNELFEQLRFGGQRPQASGHQHAEAALAIADGRAQADIVDRARNAIAARAAVEGDFELARQVARQILAQQSIRHPLCVRPHVENLVPRNARPGAGGDVAHRVVAGLAVGQPGVREHVHQVGHARQRHEMKLDILPRRQVPSAAAEFVGHARQLPRLRRGQHSAGNLRPHHLHPGLPLPVNTVL